MYFFVYIFIIFTISLTIFPKIIEDKTIYGVCSNRYLYNKRIIIPTNSALNHFIQGFIFTFFLGISPFFKYKFFRYSGILIGSYFAVLYPLYNYIKRVRINNVHFRDTSFYNNLFDFQLGMWISLVLTFIICYILNLYNFNIYLDIPIIIVVLFIFFITLCILFLSLHKFYYENTLCNYLHKKGELCTDEKKNCLCPHKFMKKNCHI